VGKYPLLDNFITSPTSGNAQNQIAKILRLGEWSRNTPPRAVSKRARAEKLRERNLFDAARVEEVKQRIARLRPDSQRQWGKMNAPQAVAHCSKGLELALGDLRPPRVLLGRIMGPIIKPKVFRNDEPLRRGRSSYPG
jgi:hypothetical protein